MHGASASVRTVQLLHCDGPPRRSSPLQALALAAAGGEARGGAVLSLMCQRLPPELRARVLAFHPEAASMPASVCRTPLEHRARS